MTDKLILPATVSYGDVDRREVMLLPRVFKLLQEAAILHANQYGTGTGAIFSRGETWMLNRIAVEIDRYPRYEEVLRLETWSSGIRGFRGYRDFRLYDAQERCLLRGSSIWLYVSLRTKAIVRVPREVVETFPVGHDLPAFPELEEAEFAAPGAEARRIALGLRFSDFDVNEHVNNAAYFDLLQTALARAGLPVEPRTIALRYAKGIPAEVDAVEVRVERMEGGDGGAAARFSVEGEGVLFAVGRVGFGRV